MTPRRTRAAFLSGLLALALAFPLPAQESVPAPAPPAAEAPAQAESPAPDAPPAWKGIEPDEQDGSFSLPLSQDGFYSVAWEGAGDEKAEGGDGEGEEIRSVVLQEADSADFSEVQIIYEGPDRATAMSGRLDGTYFYRVRWADAPADAWSPSLTARVEHRPLWQAFLALGIGALVFLSTAGLIVAGHLAHRRDVAAGMFPEDQPLDPAQEEKKQPAV